MDYKNDPKGRQGLISKFINEFCYDETLWIFLIDAIKEEDQSEMENEQEISSKSKEKKQGRDKDKDKERKAARKQKKKKDKDKRKKKKSKGGDVEKGNVGPILQQLGISDEQSFKRDKHVQKVIEIYEWATSLNRRNPTIWQNYILYLRRNKKTDIALLYKALLEAMKALKYDKSCLSIWVQLTEFWTSSNRRFKLKLDILEVNDLFIELAKSFYQFDSHFVHLFEERYSEFIKGLNSTERELFLKEFRNEELPRDLKEKARNELLEKQFSKVAQKLLSMFKQILGDTSTLYPKKGLLKEIEETLKTGSETEEKTWLGVVEKLYEFKRAYPVTDNSLELFIYEKGVSLLPDSPKLWRLYLEFLDTLQGDKKNLLFSVLLYNRKILQGVLPEAFGMTICYFHNSSYPTQIEELFKKLLQELLAKDVSLYQPSFAFLFCNLLFTLHRANTASELVTPLQGEHILLRKNDNPNGRSQEENQRDSDIKDQKEIFKLSEEVSRDMLAKLVKPDQTSEFQVFDMIVDKFAGTIEGFEVERRAEIFQLLLNRMERAPFKEDLFESKFRSFSPNNILFFKLCIEYKKTIQSESTVLINSVNNCLPTVDNSNILDTAENDREKEQTSNPIEPEVKSHALLDKTFAELFWERDSKEVSEVLGDLIEALRPKGVAKLQDMIRYYAEMYIDAPEDLQVVETTLFSKIHKLKNQFA